MQGVAGDCHGRCTIFITCVGYRYLLPINNKLALVRDAVLVQKPQGFNVQAKLGSHVSLQFR